MKLIKLHLLVAAMIIVTSGCVGSGKKYKQQENSAAGVVDSKNKDCYGTYEGILPCADCGGIKTTLKLIVMQLMICGVSIWVRRMVFLKRAVYII